MTDVEIQEELERLEKAVQDISVPLNNVLAVARDAGLRLTFPMEDSPVMYAPCDCGAADCNGEYIFHNLERMPEVVH